MNLSEKFNLSFSNFIVYRCPTNSFSSNGISNEAIYLASPTLFEQQEKNDSDKIKLSIKKYQQRASTRCTPFGLFAGCGVGKWGNENCIKKEKQYKHTRLDMEVICEIASVLTSHSLIKKHLLYYTNNSLYKVLDKFRYVEYDLKNKNRNYKITSIDESLYVKDILSLTNNGASYVDLVNCLLSHDVSIEEAEQFIDELLESQIIRTNLYPNVTGVEFYSIILDRIKEIVEKNESQEIIYIYNLLLEIDVDIKKIDARLDSDIIEYKNIFGNLKKILPQLIENNLFQTDLYYDSTSATVTKEIQAQLLETISFLGMLYEKKESQGLKMFKEKFQNRYEEQEIPLVQVLDPVSGIGYTTKDTEGINYLVDNINISNTDKDVNVKWKTSDSLLLKKLIIANSENSKIVEFTNEDLENKNTVVNIPPSISVFFSIISKTKNILQFKYAGGSSAGNLLGRFALENRDIGNLLKEIVQHETKFYSDKIIAEILHLPENRIGNILLRPHVHTYEIAYLAESTKPKNCVIDINDLLISVKNNRITLRSKKHQKEIIPRLTTAHNYNLSSLPIYQFLCDLQIHNYDKNYFSFNWGALANEFDFLPRAIYKNTILKPAQWNVNKGKLLPIIDSLKFYNQDKIIEWQNSLKLPSKFLLVDGDNELYVNIFDELSVKAFASVIKNKDKIILYEFLYDEQDTLIFDSNNKGYTNELIAILYNNEKSVNFTSKREPFNQIKRSFIIGSEWLYYKIYCTPKIAEKILSETIYSIVQNFQESGIIEKWFFIRFADPEYHLRIRFKVTDISKLSFIQNCLFKALDVLIENNLIEKIQTDTYNRELERYGFDNIENTEELFWIDSISTLNLIQGLNNDEEGDLIRLKYACLSAYQLMKDFKIDEENINLIITSSWESYFKEHGGQKDLKLLLDAKFRKYGRLIQVMIDRTPIKNLNEEDIYVMNILSKKERQQNKIIKAILQKLETKNLKVDLNDYIKSLIHMQVNRLFQGKQRIYELLIYDFLQRNLKSEKVLRLKKHNIM